MNNLAHVFYQQVQVSTQDIVRAHTKNIYRLLHSESDVFVQQHFVGNNTRYENEEDDTNTSNNGDNANAVDVIDTIDAAEAKENESPNDLLKEGRIVEWWYKSNQIALFKHLASTISVIFCVPPSSAACERAFSILK